MIGNVAFFVQPLAQDGDLPARPALVGELGKAPVFHRSIELDQRQIAREILTIWIVPRVRDGHGDTVEVVDIPAGGWVHKAQTLWEGRRAVHAVRRGDDCILRD